MMEGIRPSVTRVPLIAPQRTTWFTARAMTPSTATEVRMDSRLGTLRNLSLSTEKATMSKTRKASAGVSGRPRYRRNRSSPSVPATRALASLILGNLLLSTAGSRGHHALLGRLSPRELARDTALAHH